MIPAAIGAALGTLTGAALVIAMANNPPTPQIAAAVPLLAIISAAVGSLPAAVLAALRDPVSVLRVP